VGAVEINPFNGRHLTWALRVCFPIPPQASSPMAQPSGDPSLKAPQARHAATALTPSTAPDVPGCTVQSWAPRPLRGRGWRGRGGREAVVGWVERSDTHQRPPPRARKVGIAPLNPPYACYQFGLDFKLKVDGYCGFW